MGIALASEARDLGAEVELILARHSVEPPAGVTLRSVRTVEEMRAAVEEGMPRAEMLIMAAAVSDFVPSSVAEEKIKRGEAGLTLRLEPAPDILAEAAKTRRPGQILVGFALETSRGEERARAKIEAKGIDAIVLNDPALALDRAENEVIVFTAGGDRWELPRAPKSEIARGILGRLSACLE
ncbi:MAG: hypothetical protein CME06_09450 [Gemmatimonadetes bacterium]|nr:hypothetical protein [Gemmatimonadota bacterium]